MQKDDAASIQAQINSLNVTRFLAVVPYPYTLADAETFVNNCLVKQKQEKREGYSFAVTLKSAPIMSANAPINGAIIDGPNCISG
ncbi:Uncharacterised protein [uncultured archaeon]|nr:Uncharacterised protein [uncultured archaeon]